MSNVKKNIIYNSLYQVLSIVMPFITAPYISRVIGVNGVGVFSYTHSIAYYFGIFIFLGLQNYGCKAIAECKNKENLGKTFWQIYAMQGVMSIIVSVVYLVMIILLKRDLTVYLLWQSFYVLSFGINISWYLQGLERFDLTVKINVITKILTIVTMFIIVKDSDDLEKYTALMAISSFVTQVPYWYEVRKIPYNKPKKKDILKHIKPNLILFVPVLAVSIYRTIDKIMLGAIIDTVEVGYYENAEKIVNIPIYVIGSISTVLMPRIVSLINENSNKDKIDNYLSISYKVTIILSTAFSFGICAIAPHFIPFFYGKGYEACILLVCILIPTVILNSLSSMVRLQVLLPYGKEKVFINAVCYGAIINFLGNIIIIPLLGAQGACITTVLAEFIVTIYQFIKIRDLVNLKDILDLKYMFFIIIGIIMFFIVRYIEKLTNADFIGLMIEILVGSVIYVVFSVLYLYKCDKNLIKLDR